MKYLLICLICSVLNSEPAPNIEFVTEDGIAQQLDQYKGKVIYLSFWASWCGPCKKNFAKYKGIRSALESKGVVLLNISIDKDSENWKNALEKHSYITGVNVLATDIPKAQKNYNISKIPDYHIINKAGEFVYLSDDADRDIIKEFQKWIDQ